MDETSQKIIDAAMSLIRDKGYVATTTKDIVVSGVEQEKWRGNLTPDFVNLSIGLRAPQIYEETAPSVMKVPQAFLSSLIEYFKGMEQRGKLPHLDFECLALTIFSSTFGYTFLSASFGKNLFGVEKEQYVKQSVAAFIRGIPEIK